jgi:V8-like Glu-specific endopeptidase
VPANPAHSIVTIQQADGRPCGVGFLVGERQVLTCAHVVNHALGRDVFAGEQPDHYAAVRLEFSLIGAPRTPSGTRES